MSVDPSKPTLVKTPIIRIKGRGALMKGASNVPITICIYLKYCMLQQIFIVIMMDMVYNVILGRPFLHIINSVISIKYLFTKFHTKKEVEIIKGINWSLEGVSPYA
jgi:hypothetical protein